MAKTRLYFYLNGDLHKRLLVNRGKDLMWAWNYPRHSKVVYTWTDAVRRMEPAFSTKQVAKMVNRHYKIIQRAIWDEIVTPQMNYGLESKRPYQYMWAEDDIMKLMDYLSEIHYGRPRRDGLINPKALPTPRELRAMIRNDEIMNVPKGEKYVPSWKAKQIKGE